MQGVNARIAPVAIEVVTVAGRPGTAEFKQAAGGVKGNLGGEHFGAGNGDGSLRHMLLAEILFKAVENLARLLQQRLSGGQSAVDLPDMVDGERIVAGPFDAGINPRSGELANEADGVVEGCAGDPGINRGGGELREGAGERRRGIRFPRRERCSGATARFSARTVPLAVFRCPRQSQSSSTVKPALSRGTKASCARSSASSARMPIQWA